MKKILGIIIGMLVLGTSFSIVSATNEISTFIPSNGMNRDGTVLYVGGSGPGNFTKIQDAISAASDGDTIFVYDDSSPYNENVRVNKTVNLIGENKATTVIDGGGNEDVVTISRDYVTLSGFTLRETGWYYDGIILSANNTVLEDLSIVNTGYALTTRYAYHNTIRNIELSAGRDGMRIVFSDYNLFEDVSFLSSYQGSISVIESDNNQITDSMFAGGSLVLGSANNNTVRNNTFLSTSGFSLSNANDNVIEGNTFEMVSVSSSDSYRNTVRNNQVNGKPLAYLEDEKDQIIEDAGQVILIRCDHITVQNLQITSYGTGTSISLQETSNSVIKDNVLSGGYYGILVDSSNKNQITNNTVKNTRYGILDQNGRSNVYSDNVIQDNQYSGLTLSQSILTKVQGNTITNSDIGVAIDLGMLNTVSGNTITDNYNGIILAYTALNTIKNNNFMKNKIDALFANALRTHWARNYWGKLLPTPKIIVGAFILPDPVNPWGEKIIPFINIDKAPRLLPYKNT